MSNWVRNFLRTEFKEFEESKKEKAKQDSPGLPKRESQKSKSLIKPNANKEHS